MVSSSGFWRRSKPRISAPIYSVSGTTSNRAFVITFMGRSPDYMGLSHRRPDRRRARLGSNHECGVPEASFLVKSAPGPPVGATSMNPTARFRALGAAAALLAVAAHPALAQHAESFFKGKVINFYIGFGAGGTYDYY